MDISVTSASEKKQKIEAMTLAVIEELNQMNWASDPVAVLRVVKKFMVETEELACIGVEADADTMGEYSEIEAHLNHWLIDCVLAITEKKHMTYARAHQMKKCNLLSYINYCGSSVKFMIS